MSDLIAAASFSFVAGVLAGMVGRSDGVSNFIFWGLSPTA